MANDEHVALLKKGAAAWNDWRKENPDIRPDLRGARLAGANLGKTNLTDMDLSGAYLLGTDLRKAHLSGANLSGADLRAATLIEATLIETNLTGADLGKANLSGAELRVADLSKANLSAATLTRADLRGARLLDARLLTANLSEANVSGARLGRANLSNANLTGADLSYANLSEANLTGADLSKANLSEAQLSEANLSEANLQVATLLETDLSGADLTGCRIYGVSAWNLKLGMTKQQNLIITHQDEPAITVDNIEVAQFIYLMLHNQKVRDVIDTITSKAVLILGRFTDERKAVLDALRDELRKRNYLPILFDFNVPATRDITETISLLARMARFVVADITDAKSIPQELAVIVPDLPSVPVQPLLLEGSAEYGMFEHLKRYPWVLKTYTYASSERLIAGLGEHVIGPPENYARSVKA
jgi:uncharacterized protein YjbI with pentapeptide repeats